jgi:hypothetical protein
VSCDAQSVGEIDANPAIDSNARRAKIQNNLFACEKNGGASLLSQAWSVYLLGADGSTSLWLVQGSSRAQQVQSYRAEMEAVQQARSVPLPYVLSLGARVDNTRPGLESAALLEFKQAFLPELAGRLDAAFPLNDYKKWDAQIGLELQLWKESLISPRAAFLVGYDRWDANTRVWRNEADLDLVLLPSRHSFAFSLLARAGWPDLARLRDDWALGMGLDWSRHAERGLGFRAELVYASRIGSVSASSEQVDSRGLRARLVVSWLGGSF